MVRFALALHAQEVQDDGRGGMVLVPPGAFPDFHEGDVVQLTRFLPSCVGPVSSGTWRPERRDFQQWHLGSCGTAWWDRHWRRALACGSLLPTWPRPSRKTSRACLALGSALWCEAAGGMLDGRLSGLPCALLNGELFRAPRRAEPFLSAPT